MRQLSEFPELNVRTYVINNGKPGVYFFSLDATNALAVAVARRFFHLAYFRADIRLDFAGNSMRYSSTRTQPGAAPAVLRADYRPAGPVQLAVPGTLAHWLTERYCLYTAHRDGSLMICEIHHAPWPLQPAHAEIQQNTIVQAAGLQLPPVPPILHFSKRLDVKIWPLQRCRC